MLYKQEDGHTSIDMDFKSGYTVHGSKSYRAVEILPKISR